MTFLDKWKKDFVQVRKRIFLDNIRIYYNYTLDEDKVRINYL